SQPHYPTLISSQELPAMNRKWIGFAVVATLVAASGLASRLSVAQDQEKHKENDTPLGRIMEKVQKHNIAITKATRNVAAFKKNQKEVEKSAAEQGATQKEAKDLFQSVKKTCSDCHTVFRVESEF